MVTFALTVHHHVHASELRPNLCEHANVLKGVCQHLLRVANEGRFPRLTVR